MSITEFYCNDQDEIRDLLVGHSVRKVTEDQLQLDDGTILELTGNVGCGWCPSGWYELETLNDCPNVITNVEFDYDDFSYKVFVFADNQRINLFTFEGDDGNGYYGAGYWITVKGVTDDY